MSNRKSFFAGIGVTVTLGFLVLMLSGAVKTKTPNYYEHMSSHIPEAPAINVACSADGSTVYIADRARVMRSQNYGSDWEIVMTQFKWEGNQK